MTDAEMALLDLDYIAECCPSKKGTVLGNRFDRVRKALHRVDDYRELWVKECELHQGLKDKVQGLIAALEKCRRYQVGNELDKIIDPALAAFGADDLGVKS